jgi:hypothetical protein
MNLEMILIPSWAAFFKDEFRDDFDSSNGSFIR